MLAGAVLALAAAIPAHAAPRDLDRTFGDGGVTLTSVGVADAAASAIARQPDGRVILVGNAKVAPPSDGHNNTGVAMVRYLPDGTVDRSFGGGDGVVEQFGPEGSMAQAVALQPDGRILVSGITGFPAIAGPLFVARYLPDGSRDGSFGDNGVAFVPVCCDAAGAEGLALQPDGKIVLAGYRDNTDSADTIVARFTRDGQLDPAYGDGGVSRLQLGDASPTWSRAHGLVLQGEKAVIVGNVATGGEQRVFSSMLARLDEHGALDRSFGTDGLVVDHAMGMANAIGQAPDGKLIVAGDHRSSEDGAPRADYVLSRYSADGALDESFNPDGPSPGHVVATAGSDRYAVPTGLAVDPSTGSATVTGYARDEGKTKLLLVRYTTNGLRDDAGFRSASGSAGPRLLDAGDGGNTSGTGLVLDPYGGMLVAGAAVDGGLYRFLVARYGDPPPVPNARPVARIGGRHTVRPERWVRFDASRSYDRDGDIVDYAWRVGYGRWHRTGPTFWHRFPSKGAAKVILRVTDDDGSADYAALRVKVR